MNLSKPLSLLRLAGWLLTPFVVWAASLLSAWLGLSLTPTDVSGTLHIGVLLGGALLGGTAGLVVWVLLMTRGKRRSRNRTEGSDGPGE